MRAPLHELRAGVDFDRATLPNSDLELLRWLASPTLISVEGADPTRTRLVSTLLHANEPSGLAAVRRYLVSSQEPATNVLFFLGSVQTALTPPLMSHRSLPGAPDANRVWTEPWDTPEGEIAARVLARIREVAPECGVDLHNNTGHNPAYGVAFRADAAEKALISLFADRVVHTPLELRTLVEATMHDFPCVAIECGLSGAPEAEEVAWQGLCRFLAADHLDFEHVPDHLEVLGAPVRVCVEPEITLAFGDAPDANADLTISKDIDRHNFERLPAGSPIGWIHDTTEWPFHARAGSADDCSRNLFRVDDGVVRVCRDLIPVMMTTNREIAMSDCLFYAVQPEAKVEASPDEWWR